MARRPPQSEILRRSEIRKRNRQKRRERNRKTPLTPAKLPHPRCWVCLTDSKELKSQNPRVQWYQNKFCICTGSLGTICEVCMRKLPFDILYRDLCPNCKTPWKKEDLRIVRLPYTAEEWKRFAMPYVFWIGMVVAILPLYFMITGFFWPHSQELKADLYSTIEDMTSSKAIKWVVWAILNILVWIFLAMLSFVVVFYIDYFIIEAIPLFHLLFSKFFKTRRVVSVEVLGKRRSPFRRFNYSINSWVDSRNGKGEILEAPA